MKKTYAQAITALRSEYEAGSITKNKFIADVWLLKSEFGMTGNGHLPLVVDNSGVVSVHGGI